MISVCPKNDHLDIANKHIFWTDSFPRSSFKASLAAGLARTADAAGAISAKECLCGDSDADNTRQECTGPDSKA